MAGGKISSGQIPGGGRVRSSLWPGALLKDSRSARLSDQGAQPALGNRNLIFL